MTEADVVKLTHQENTSSSLVLTVLSIDHETEVAAQDAGATDTATMR